MSQLRMDPVSTGVVAVDNAVRGFLRGDVEAAVSQLVMHRVECGTVPRAGKPALACLAAEPPGTVHELILSTCEARWVTAEVARAEIGSLIADAPGLYAAARRSGGFSAVLSWRGAPGESLVLSISSAGVESYGAGCGPPASPMASRELKLLPLAAD